MLFTSKKTSLFKKFVGPSKTIKTYLFLNGYVIQWLKKDLVKMQRQKLPDLGVAENDIPAMEKEIEQKITESIEFAIIPASQNHKSYMKESGHAHDFLL